MKKRQKQVQAFSILATIMMIFSLITPSFTFAEPKGSISHSLHDAKNQVRSKVNSSLQDQFENEDTVRFLIKFTETTDVMGVAQEARESAQKASLSAMGQEHAQRSAVISELKQTSMESQQSVTEFLEEAEQEGIAEDIRSYHIVNGMAVTATKEVAEKLVSFPEVEKLLQNEERELIKAADSSADVPENETAEIEWNVDRVGAPSVWDMGFDGQGVVVASIDTGADWEHPALKEKYRGYDPDTEEVDHTYSFYDPVNGEKEPYDLDSHGTHVTGTMVGSEADGSNQIGVAPGAQWISVQAFSDAGAYDDDLLAAAEWILAPGDDVTKAPDVVNNSWGGGPGLDEWYLDAVTAWRAAGIFPAFAAGNTTLTNPGGPGSVAVPANYPESFATGSTNASDNLSTFSLHGPSPYDEVKPDIAAPGEGIRSAMPGGGYGGKSGTSMASPAIAGIVALMKSANANLDVDVTEEILMEMADSDSGTDSSFPDSPNNGYGHGIVDAHAAVSSVVSGLGIVEGQVTMDGEDNESPTFEHEAPGVIYDGMGIDLNMHAQDNVSVLNVELSYQINDGEWQTVEANRISGDYTDGEYVVNIEGEELNEGTLTYEWVIHDYGNNEVVSEQYEVPIHPGISIGYFEDFEETPEGWTSFGAGDDWEWGIPTSGPDSASSGEKVYATNLDGSYQNDANATLVMPAVNLPEGDAYLHFELWYDLVEVHDSGYVYVSTDQEEWNMEQIVYYASDGWRQIDIDLSEYSGERVYIGFNITSRAPTEVEKPGMYLDNVGISDSPQYNSQSMTQDLAVMEDDLQKHNMDMKELLQHQPEKRSFIDQEEQTLSKGLPLDAQVSVLETGRSTATDPQDGSYSLMHAAGSFTMVAEAYGFHASEQSVDIAADGTVDADFTMEELPQGTIRGKVTNENTGDPIDGATLLLAEDANVEPAVTDQNGNYDLTGYEGTYTLKVNAKDFHSKEMEITLDGDQELDIELEPFYTVPGGEIYYDDGTAENARAFYDAGNKWAVKMSLPEDEEKALVTDGVFQFQDTDFPDPGDTPFAVEVWSAGDDGMPDERLAGPIDADAVRDLNEWTVVDLRDENIQVQGDFYMVYVQVEENPYVPALATDENGPYAERSYQEVDGSWSQSPADEGNYMIRARVDYEVETPEINSPEDGMVTNEPEVTVEGTATAGTTIEVLQNGEEAGSVEIGEDGSFAVDTELAEGENVFRAVTYVNGEQADESDPVTVTLDTESPELTIDSPEDGENTNRETATVEGTVSDEHLDTVTVNGQETAVEDGAFSQRILLDEGENVIEVAATDLAGNSVTETVTVFSQYNAPEISNLTPDEDVELETGQSVKIEFESEPGLRTSFVVHMPLTDFGIQALNATELPMMETTPGNYVGYYTVPRNAYADGAVIEVIAKDEFGNETRQQAEGKLLINVE